MLKTFEEIIEVVLEHEGGFTDDPKDPGNWTGGKGAGVGEASYPTFVGGSGTVRPMNLTHKI